MNAVEWLIYAAAWQAWLGPRREASEWDAATFFYWHGLAIVLAEGDRLANE